MSAFQTASAIDVWIDTDVAIASPFREPDDAFALVVALNSRELQPRGISTTYGNGPLSLTERSARELMTHFDGSAQLLQRGARSAAELGAPSDATNTLAIELQKRRLTVLALGPLTNLASLLILHPELTQQIERIIFVGGCTHDGHIKLGFIRVHDANVLKDPAAADIVLRSQIPLLVIPVDVSAQLGLNNNDLRQLRASGAAGKFLMRKTRLWSLFFTHVVRREAPIFDALAIVAASRSELCHFEDRRAVVDRSRMWLRPIESNIGIPVRVCTAMKAGVKEFVLQRLRSR